MAEDDGHSAFHSIEVLAQNSRAVFVGLIIGSAFYGIHACVYFTTTYCIYRARRRGKRMPTWSFIYTGILFVLGTAELVGTSRNEELALLRMRTDVSLMSVMVQDVLSMYGFLVAVALQDGMLIYRLFVIWNHNIYVIVLPILALLASTGLSIYSNLGLGTPDRTSSIVFYSLSMTLNIVLTAMVVGRMLFLRRRAIKLLGTYHARLYSSVASIFLESGMLYTSFGVLYLVSRSAGSGASYVIMMALGQVVCIAPELILLHVARGRAWTREMSELAPSPHSSRNPSSPTLTVRDVEPFSRMRCARDVAPDNVMTPSESRTLKGGGTVNGFKAEGSNSSTSFVPNSGVAHH